MTLPSSGPLSLNDIQGEFGGSNPIGMNEYYAGGGLVPAGTTGTYGAVPSSGALSIQNFYGTSQFVPIYIEDVFSTWLYTGNGATQTITNGINLSGNGGLVWASNINNYQGNGLWDTARGASASGLSSYSRSAVGTGALSSFNSTGFTLSNYINSSSYTYCSWTFRKQPKFFDVVTYTGTGTARTIAHNLGSVPGCIIVKSTNTNDTEWFTYHKDLTSSSYALYLNRPNAEVNDTTVWNATAPTSTVFSVGTNASTNAAGSTYVAYIFASNAGGFGLTGSDNVITCGTYTGNGSASGPTVTLGYEPQWVMIKNAAGYSDWVVLDTMRGMSLTTSTMYSPSNVYLYDFAVNPSVIPNATGFSLGTAGNFVNDAAKYIYIAIRRGPMKVPTTGTSVFSPIVSTGGAGTVYTTGFPIDLAITSLTAVSSNKSFVDRLRGSSSTTTASGQVLMSDNTAAEASAALSRNWNNTGFEVPPAYGGYSTANWNFRRAPGFFDEVCYTGTGTTRLVTHNLAAVPELVIIKCRSSAVEWPVYTAATGTVNYLSLNSTAASGPFPGMGGFAWIGLTTSYIVTGAGPLATNQSGQTYVAYLFASCPGVSKVGSYTGTGTTQQINCGFTGGARFVLIKSTNTTGDWYVWDSARGIVAGNDPYLKLNTTDAEVTTTDWVDTDATGFQLSNAGGNLANSNGVSYIFLAIA